jgi:hypothetical protein
MNNTGKLKKSTFAALALTLTLLGGGAELRAADGDLVVDPVVSTESYYANPAQAAHAEKLAEQAAMSDPEAQAALEDVDAAQADLEAAQTDLDAAQTEVVAAQKALDDLNLAEEPPSPEQLAAAELALQDANQDLLAAQTNLGIAEETHTKAEEAFADTIAAATGVNAAEIEALRTAGMGWGQIALDLGVHPSTLGLGHGKKTGTQAEVTTTTAAIDGIEAEELAEATARNTRNGLSKGQGQTSQSRIHEPGTGLTATGATAAKDKTTTRSGIHEPGTGLTATGDTAPGNSRGERNAGPTSDQNTTAGSGNGAGNSNAGGNSGNSNGNSGGNDKGADNSNAGGNSGNSGGNDKGGGNSNAGGNSGNSGGNDKGGGNDEGNGHGGGNDKGGGNGGGGKK